MIGNVTKAVNARRIVVFMVVVVVSTMAFGGSVAATHIAPGSGGGNDYNGDEENNAVEQTVETLKEVAPSGISVYDPTGVSVIISGVQSFDDYDTDNDGLTLEEEWNRETPDWLAPMFGGCDDLSDHIKCM